MDLQFDDKYTPIRKYRMLTEWWFKVFWPSCDACGQGFVFDRLVETRPCFPEADLEHGVLRHQDCQDHAKGRLQSSLAPVRIMAYRVFLTEVFELYQVRCWYCLEDLWSAESLSGAIPLTLHHLDEDRGDSRLRGKNSDAELECLHTACHKKHHGSAEGHRADPYTRLNGERESGQGRAKSWVYEK